MKKAIGNLHVRIFIDCPECQELLDLFEKSDVGDLNGEEGKLWKIVKGTQSWKDLAINVECKRCKKGFIFDRLEY